MNREQRRKFTKRAKKRGLNERMTELYLSMDREGLEKPAPPQKIKSGDKVMLDLERIKSRKNYDRMTDLYKEFVNASDGAVFTAKVERENLVSMEEDPRWLFWSGDLILVSEPVEEEQGA